MGKNQTRKWRKGLFCILCHSSVINNPQFEKLKFNCLMRRSAAAVKQQINYQTKYILKYMMALCGSKRVLFSFHLHWRFPGTDGWYTIQLLRAGGDDNTRAAPQPTVSLLPSPACLGACSIIMFEREGLPSKRNQRRPVSDHYSTVWKVLDSLESFASGEFEEGLRQAASWTCQWTHFCFLKDYRNHRDIKELCSYPCHICAAFFLSKWGVGVNTTYLTPWLLIWGLGAFGLFA